MSAQHTPGEWHVEDPMGDGLEDALWVVIGDEAYDWRTVALVPCDTDKGSVEKPISRKQRDANARLIAAAPDLLEVLSELVGAAGEVSDLLGEEDWTVTQSVLDGYVVKARALLAKIGGEA